MGYYTTFTFKVLSLDGKTDKTDEFFSLLKLGRTGGNILEDPSIYKEEYVKKVREITKKYIPVANIIDLIEYSEPHKWYEHETDMMKFSQTFPEYIFSLEGNGEDSGDIWKKWFYKGKMQGGKAKIVFPEMELDKFGLRK